ncbi:MarR family winged helix-turn-helix transcriptional regulator [Parafrigoribacterium soli]|uniref:MarR family winged helix-turn-helix transcriptional regulator n=1 Tax=Parafrigoribacterium soli TaxID=3144663 RepID=UPI0032ECF6CF
MSATVPDNLIPFLLMASFRGLIDTLHARLAECGFGDVRAIHGMAMQAIGEGCTSTEVARRLGVSKQAAAVTVRALADLGLAASEANPHDRRERLITPSDRGSDMLAQSGRILTDVIGTWREELGDDAVNATIRTLAAVDHGRRSITDVSDWL